MLTITRAPRVCPLAQREIERGHSIASVMVKCSGSARVTASDSHRELRSYILIALSVAVRVLEVDHYARAMPPRIERARNGQTCARVIILLTYSQYSLSYTNTLSRYVPMSDVHVKFNVNTLRLRYKYNA